MFTGMYIGNMRNSFALYRIIMIYPVLSYPSQMITIITKLSCYKES